MIAAPRVDSPTGNKYTIRFNVILKGSGSGNVLNLRYFCGYSFFDDVTIRRTSRIKAWMRKIKFEDLIRKAQSRRQ